MLENHENPSKLQFWLKWLALIVFAALSCLGSFKYIEYRQNIEQKNMNQKVLATKRQMPQIVLGINMNNIKHGEKDLNSLVGYDAVMERLIEHKFLISRPENVISNYEFLGNGIEFIGMKFDNKKLCQKFLSDENQNILSFKSIHEANEELGKKGENAQIFCYKSKKEKKNKYIAALKI